LAREAAALSLFDALTETGFQSSVVATYCCYFPFYEDVILRRLLDRGCTNNILMVDARLCAQAFANEHARPRRAGRDYTLVPVELGGAFHPKLIVAVGKSKGALFVGSHNTTLAGFGLNDEITNEFRTTGPGGRHGAGPIRAALDYLQGFAPKALAEIAHVFAAVRQNVPWLGGPAAVESDDRILMVTTGRDADLWSRVRPLVPKRSPLAFVCGPFFDKNLEFLQRLVSDAKPRKLIVGIDPESAEIDPNVVRKFRGAAFVNIAGLPHVPNRRESGARYLHAKVLWFSGTDGELLVTGSANPSKAAFLSAGGKRNAEAIVVDRRAGAAKALGLNRLVSAPAVHEKDWAQVTQRQAAQQDDERNASGTVILAVPSDDGFELERSLDTRVALTAFSADGAFLGRAAIRRSDSALVEAPAEIRDRADTLRGLGPNKKALVILIHRPDEVAKNIGGDRQRELRQALGALDEDPAQLETLLKVTEKVIFDSGDVVCDESPIRGKPRTTDRESADTGPKSFAVDAAGRAAGRKKKRLASGDILLLLDALMYRLGEGLRSPAAPRAPTEEVRPVPEDDTGEEEPPPAPPPYEILADTCRAKVGRLIRRMIKQLNLTRTAGARRAVVQLAAVLSVIHTLRIMEQRVEWRSKHLKLVDPDHEWLLFKTAALAIAWGGSGLAPRAISESGGELFEELSLTTALLAWLAWEADVDVKAAIERTSPIDLEEEVAPWYGIQLFAAIAPHLSEDADARETLTAAVTRTPRKGADISSWLKIHLRIADRLARVITVPESVSKLVRGPLPGDLVVLRPGLDPRVRIALEVEPSSLSDKITVLEPDDEDGERQFLASYVRYAALLEQEPASKRVANL
jgi:hypothetical protein